MCVLCCVLWCVLSTHALSALKCSNSLYFCRNNSTNLITHDHTTSTPAHTQVSRLPHEHPPPVCLPVCLLLTDRLFCFSAAWSTNSCSCCTMGGSGGTTPPLLAPLSPDADGLPDAVGAADADVRDPRVCGLDESAAALERCWNSSQSPS